MALADERSAARAQPPTVDPHAAGHEPTMLAAHRDIAPDAPAARVNVNVIAAHGEPGALSMTARDTTGLGRIEGRNLRLPAVFAGLGLFATSVVICAAVKLRSPSVVAALEQPARAESKAAPASAPSGTLATKTTKATKPSAAPDAAPVLAPATELERAQAGGLASLVSLSQRYPNDPAVLRALVLAHGRERAYMAAVQAAKRLFELAPEETGNEDIRQLILRSANATPDVAVAALDLMAKGMGSRGPDMLYEVITVPQFGDYPRDKASKLLLDDAVRQLASPALLVADDLRRTTTCPAKPLLERAGAQGDLRARQHLKALLVPQRCGLLGFRKCLKCGSLQKDIRATVNAIEKRRNDSEAASSAPASSKP
jgi:hypothetical protein